MVNKAEDVEEQRKETIKVNRDESLVQLMGEVKKAESERECVKEGREMVGRERRPSGSFHAERERDRQPQQLIYMERVKCKCVFCFYMVVCCLLYAACCML